MSSALQTRHGSEQFGALLSAGDFVGGRSLCLSEIARADSRMERFRWLVNLTALEFKAHDLLTARSASDAAAELLREVEDSALRGHHHNNRGAVLGALGDADTAFIEYAVASKYYAESGREDLVAEVQNNTGLLYAETGQFEMAFEYLERAREKYARLNDWNHLADVYDSLSKACRAKATR
jgi:tetratricopeptide (TPR) repeat protein